VVKLLHSVFMLHRLCSIKEVSFSNFCCSSSHQQETSRYPICNWLLLLDRWYRFRESRIPKVQYVHLKFHIRIMLFYVQINNSQWSWSTIWSTTKNHGGRSWGDCSMGISSLSQVSNIFPISVCVFGNCWRVLRWAAGRAADYQNTFAGWSGSIFRYS